MKFKRRIYGSVSELARDFAWPFRQRAQLRAAMRGDLVSHQFRERLMLAVTAVNQCRYCSYFHAREALSAGLSTDEIRQLNDGVIDDAPAEELPALLYAQHWAESNSRPDPIARARLVEIYGPQRSEAIETVLRMIRTGNLLGNSADYLLARLTFGRFGVTADEREGRAQPLTHTNADI
jgi:AhpD family alkylhydroperoxidase